MMESLGFIALCLAGGLILWNRWQTKHTMQRLDEMLTSAMNGNFTEKVFDESRLSALESRLSRYLSASSLSARKIQEQKDQISALISDISHQTKTPVVYPAAFGTASYSARPGLRPGDFCADDEIAKPDRGLGKDFSPGNRNSGASPGNRRDPGNGEPGRGPIQAKGARKGDYV